MKNYFEQKFLKLVTLIVSIEMLVTNNKFYCVKKK